MKYFKICLLVFGLLLSTKIFAQVNPSLNYYPLHIGDEWQYKITYRPPDYKEKTFYLSRKVLSDTVLTNGQRYFLIEQPAFTWEEIKGLERIFVRVDSSNGMVYQFISANQREQGIDSLFCRAGDKFSWGTICWGVSDKTIFSMSKETVTLGSPTTTNGNDLMWMRAMDIGIYYQSNFMSIVASTGNQYDLVYAKINGVEYGQLVDVKEEKNNIPQEFSLSQNFPNPFNPSTAIKFSIPSVGAEHVQPLHVTLKVYDLLGREITTLVNEEKAPGNYEVRFNAETRRGESIPSGVYIYRLQAGSYSKTKKMILLK